MVGPAANVKAVASGNCGTNDPIGYSAKNSLARVIRLKNGEVGIGRHILHANLVRLLEAGLIGGRIVVRLFEFLEEVVELSFIGLRDFVREFDNRNRQQGDIEFFAVFQIEFPQLVRRQGART